MTRFVSGLLATTLAASFAIAGAAAPAAAATMFLPRAHHTPATFHRVHYRPQFRPMGNFYQVAPRQAFYRSGDVYYYHGYRGVRLHRNGYRELDGWWFPATAFAAGALISGAFATPVSVGDAHVNWCYGHYATYRASDNTWKPLNLPRQQCISPHD